MKNILRKIFIILTATIFLSTGLANAAPITADQQDALEGTWLWYDPTKPGAFCGPGSAGGATVEPGENKRAAFLYFVARGLTAFQSAGIVGNLVAESQVEPTAVEANPPPHVVKPGFGIAQWSDVRQPSGQVSTRRTDLENFARNNGKELTSLQYQLDYLYDQELVGNSYYKRLVYDPLIKTTTIRQASDIFLHKFEAPGNATSQEPRRAALGQQIYDLYGSEAASATPVSGTTPAPAGSTSPCAGAPGGGAAGFVGFPLQTTKAEMDSKNGGCFSSATQKMCEGGHPYAAHDIMVSAGTNILSIADGEVVGGFIDRCGGRSVSIYNSAQDVVISYLHMGNVSVNGGSVTAGQVIGTVGSSDGAACGTGAHLHIDAATGRTRPGCSRLSCPAANAAKFRAGADKIGLAAGLYTGYAKLP